MTGSRSIGVKAYGLGLFSRLAESPLYSNAFYLVLNNAAGSMLGFAFMVIMTRTFAPSIIGIGSALTAAGGLISTLANLSLGTGMVRFAPELKERAWQLVNSVLAVTALTTVLASLVYLAGVGEWSPALLAVQKSRLLAAGFILTTVLSTSSGLMDASFIARRNCRFVFIKNLLGSMVRMPLPFVVFAGLGGYGIFFSLGLATFIAMALAFGWFVPAAYPGFRLTVRIDGRLLARIIPFSFSNYLANLFSSVAGFVFPLMVLNTLGAAPLAYFYMPWLIAGVIGTIPNSVSTAIFAEASHNPLYLGRHLRRALAPALLLLFAATAVIQSMSGWLLGIFGYAYAVHGRSVLFWLMAANFPGAVGAFYLTVNQVGKKVSLIILQSFATSALTIPAAYVLMERMGLAGIGAGYTLGNLLVALVVAVPLWRAGRNGETGPDG